MKPTNLYRIYLPLLLFCTLALGVTSCINDEALPAPGNQPQFADLRIDVSNGFSQNLTRAEVAERKDLSIVKQLHIVLVQADGVIKKILRITEADAPLGQMDFTTSGLWSGQLPDTPLTYHVGVSDMLDVEQIFVVGNYVSPSDGQLADLPLTAGTATLDQLKALPMVQPADFQLSPMFGEATFTGTTHKEDEGHELTGQNYSVSMERTMSMITLGFDGTKLRNGLVITPQTATLYNVPKHAPLGQNKEITAIDEMDAKGDELYLNPDGTSDVWPALANETTAAAAGLTGVSATTTPIMELLDADAERTLYMVESYKGDKVYNGAEGNKKEPPVTDADEKKTYSYIEVVARYEYNHDFGDTETITDGSNKEVTYLSGIIKYRFYLGKDTREFNVMRNTNYELTLTLAGWAGLVEEGKVTDKTYDPDDGDVHWRVDSDLSTGGGFVGGVTDLPVGGNVIEIPIQFDPSKVTESNYGDITITRNGSGSNSFIRVWIEQGGKWDWGTSTTFTLDQVTTYQPDGKYTFKIFVRPWAFDPATVEQEVLADNASGIIMPEGTQLNTVENWLRYGKRTQSFTFSKDGGAVDPNAKTTVITQWLPLPIYPDGIPANANPKTATMFYDRMDMKGGKMPWCSDAFNAIDWGANSTEWGDQALVDGNGFRNTVALFKGAKKHTGNNDTALDALIDFKGGFPESVLEYAFFESGNATTVEQNDKVQVRDEAHEVTEMYRYGLASKEEWKLIETCGIKDENYPLYPYGLYWTSSPVQNGTEASTTQSYAYRYGLTWEAQPRSMECRARMIYRYDESTPVTIP